jgi:hypothetical protein
MKRVSQIELAELTQKDRKTIRYLLANLNPIPGPRGAKLYPSNLALETIYLGSEGAITNAEAVRQLNIAKKEEIELQMQITRGERIPREDVEAVCALVFQAIRGVIKASKLPIESCNEIFDSLRATTQELRHIADEVGTGNGQRPANIDSANVAGD